MTLYLKYRSKNLGELDLTDVSESLKKIVKSGKIPHAFLFAGPKGTGKTSAARILAKIVNCENIGKDLEPCDKCEQCISITKGTNLDVIEMDAASHRGIDDVRTLRDAVKLSPTAAKKKIYIIDEAHMLTTEASNALLKTLEEPPEHVIFVLATTNPEKLIDTIKSRTTYIPFRKATTEELVRSLRRVADGEKIKIDDKSLEVIAKASDGAFRDGIKILEQLVAEEKELSGDFLEEYLFRKKSFDTDRFVDFLIERNTKAAIEEIGKLGPSGVATEVFLEALLTKLRAGLLSEVGIGEGKINLNKSELIELIELFSEAGGGITSSLIEELPLELAVIKWGEGEDRNRLPTLHEKKNARSGEAGGGGNIPETSAVIKNFSDSEKVSDINDARTVSSSVQGGSTDSLNLNGVEELKNEIGDEIWKNILTNVKPINASIEALLRASRPLSYDGRTLTLGVFYKFHKERLEDAHHRKVLEEIVAKVLNSPTRVVCILTEPPPKKIVEEAKVEPILTEGKDADIIKAAEEIFGN